VGGVRHPQHTQEVKGSVHFEGEIIQFIDGAPCERNLMTMPKDGAVSII
jgi:hypothetical protein